MRIGVVMALVLVIAVPAAAWRRPPKTPTPTRTAVRTRTLTPTKTPMPPELVAAICGAGAETLARNDLVLMTEYYATLACLGWTEVTTTAYYPVCWSLAWRPGTPCNPPRRMIDWLRTVRLPVRECPQSIGNWCCSDYANNWCDCHTGAPTWEWCDCDGIYLGDYGSGPGPRRVAGVTLDCQHGPVIGVPVTCTSGHDAWRHELIHLLRRERGDPQWYANDSWWGWRCQ